VTESRLRAIPLEPVANEFIVKALEETLEEAKAGRIVAFSIAMVDHQGATLTRFTNACTTRLIGATSHLLWRLNEYWNRAE